MFYYLLFNSSFIKSKDIKEKLISTIIYGSFIYLIIHAIISFSFQKYNILKYFWGFFLIDIFTLISKNNISIMNYIYDDDDNKIKYINDDTNIENLNKEKNIKSIIKKTNKLSDDIKNEIVKKKKSNKKKNKEQDKKNISFDKEETLEFDKNEPVKNLKINVIENETEETNDIEKLNLTLDNLEKLNNTNEIEIPSFKNNNLGSSIIKELKKDDDASDATSFIDLENFEKTAFG